jgi:NO-binding membrane sensor protein with MHYT domain
MNFAVGQLLNPEYKSSLVIMSYMISVLGSLMALQCAQAMFRPDGTVDKTMAVGAAVSLGGIGIWSMHFIGMLAYKIGVPIAYDMVLTLVSLVAAIVISGLALYFAGGKGQFKAGGWIVGSLLAGVGVCVMHYMGMFSMNIRADMSLDVGIVAGSVAIAVAAAAAALWLAFNVKTFTHRCMAALVMGVAVCAMHYTGMSAASFVCTEAAPAVLWKISSLNLDIWIFAIALGVCASFLPALISRAGREMQAV